MNFATIKENQSKHKESTGRLIMKLFGNKIDPCCSYCEHSRPLDDQMVFCPKKGIVALYYSCRQYQYAPLKRVPRRNQIIPKYKQEDFEL